VVLMRQNTVVGGKCALPSALLVALLYDIFCRMRRQKEPTSAVTFSTNAFCLRTKASCFVKSRSLCRLKWQIILPRWCVLAGRGESLLPAARISDALWLEVCQQVPVEYAALHRRSRPLFFDRDNCSHRVHAYNIHLQLDFILRTWTFCSRV